MSVCVSIVTYNSAGVIADCLRSIPQDAEIYIADNGSRDQTIDIARSVRPDAFIKRLRRNVGFGRAHNINFRRSQAPFILILNPDTILLPGCLDHLLQAAQRYPDSGLIGAIHQQADGRLNACFKNDIDFYPQLVRRTTKARLSSALVPDGDICVEQVTGALMLLKRSVLQAVNGFSPQIFMYFEDDDLCARIRKAGYSIILTPDARVIHLEGRSSRAHSFRIDRIKGYHFERSRKIVHAMYHGHNKDSYTLVTSGLWRCLRRAIRYGLKNDMGRSVYYLSGMAGLLSPLPKRKR